MQHGKERGRLGKEGYVLKLLVLLLRDERNRKMVDMGYGPWGSSAR